MWGKYIHTALMWPANTVSPTEPIFTNSKGVNIKYTLFKLSWQKSTTQSSFAFTNNTIKASSIIFTCKLKYKRKRCFFASYRFLNFFFPPKEVTIHCLEWVQHTPAMRIYIEASWARCNKNGVREQRWFINIIYDRYSDSWCLKNNVNENRDAGCRGEGLQWTQK